MTPAMSDVADVLILQHVPPEPPGRIRDALEAHACSHHTVRIFRDDPVPETLNADGLVVMGGPMGVGDIDERPHLRQEMALIEQALRADLPVLGICLGSQLLAHALGATVYPGSEKEIGWHEVTLTGNAETDPLFQDVAPSFTAFHWHGDVFDLPNGAVPLARSAQTKHQAFRYGEHAYGLLFHLEVTPSIVDGMTRAFADELAAEGLDGAAIRNAASTHVDTLAEIADTVFGKWAQRI
jgi:GMP synthase (glutamine-hydrolysing)